MIYKSIFFFREFTYWLQSLQTNQAETARLRGGQSQQGQVSNMTPQVTISGVTGNIVQYDMMSSPTMENRTPRPWRSNSLTPPSNVSSNLSPASPSTASEWFGVSKGRSHSLTFDRDQAGLSEAAKNISPASSTTALDEKEIEEMIKLLPEGSGMRGKPIHNKHIVVPLWAGAQRGRKSSLKEALLFLFRNSFFNFP